VENFSSEDKANEFEEFFRINKTPELEKSIEKSIEKIRINAKWLNRDIVLIREYFNKNSFDSAKFRTL
jgi:aminopeptidase N